jgi:hypothetical protein
MDTSLASPYGLAGSSVEEIIDNPQYGFAKTSSAFPAVEEITLKPGENITIASIYGKADHIEQVPKIASYVTVPGFVEKKFQRARSMINELSEPVQTNTVNPLFDGTVRQMFLDNGLRGGFPTVLGLVDSDATYDEDSRVKIFHSFSRIHGKQACAHTAWSVSSAFFVAPKEPSH